MSNANAKVEPPAESGVELVKVDPYRRELEPRDIAGAFTLCEQIAKSGLCGIKTPEEALARLMTGRELGLTAMQSLRGIYTVNGRPAMDASLMMALCMRHPDCERFEFTVSTTERAVLAIKRRGRSAVQIEWTIDDAKRVGLTAKADSNWAKYPAQMLRARCKADGARLEFSDILFGLTATEELYDPEPVPEPVPERVPAVVVGVSPAEPNAESYARDKVRDEFLAKIAAADADKRALVKEISAASSAGKLEGAWLDAVRDAFKERFAAKKAAPPPPPPVSAERVVVHDADGVIDATYEREPGSDDE